MSDLVTSLNIKAGMIENCEKIAWGSETALMRQAATEITRLKGEVESLRNLLKETMPHLRYLSDISEKVEELYIRIDKILQYKAMKGE
jgi:hypothetical protein